MKHTDIERLEKMGYDVKPFYDENVFIISTKKDHWEGVEFIKTDGKIAKIKREDEHGFYYGDGNFVGRNYKGATTSTESEYVEQLKKEAFERFGEIKAGDRVHRDWLGWKEGTIGEHKGSGFEYKKVPDLLLFEGSIIYEKGKWATKLPERVEVSFCWNKDEKHDRVYFNFHKNTGCEYEIGPSLFTDDNPSKIKAIGDFLSKQLEKYLNDNQELDYGKCGSCRLFKDDISCTNSKCSNFLFK